MHETHLSTQRTQAGKDPRVPQAHVYQGRPGGDPVAPGEGTPSPVGVISAKSPERALTPIRSRHTFEDLRRSRIRGRSGPLTVVFVPQTTWSRCEVAYAINKKLGNAVTRNRLRRRLRSILSDRASELPAGAYLIRADPGAPSLAFNELRVAMSQALERAVGRVDGLVSAASVPR
jgi:ribonuclease P protein component